MFDLGVFEQAVWKLAHFHAPYVTMVGWNAFADHFSPVLVLFAPLYRIAATPVWFFIAQGAALGIGLLALPSLLDEIGLRAELQPAVFALYALSPLLWNATLFDFHPTTLAVPFLIVGLTASYRGDLKILVVCAAALLLLRDDLGIAAAVMVLWGAHRGPNLRSRGALASVGVAWTVGGAILAGVFGADRHWAFHYGYIAATPLSMFSSPFHSITAIVQQLFRPNVLRYVLVILLFPFALLPLVRPRRLLLVFLLAAPVLLDKSGIFRRTFDHYPAVLFPFLLAAMIEGLPRVARFIRAQVLAAGVAAVGVVAFIALAPLPSRIPHVPDRSVVEKALALVRPSDSVSTLNILGAHLANRETLVLFPYPFVATDVGIPLSNRARDVSVLRARGITVVIVDTHAPNYEAFLLTPGFKGLNLIGQFGSLLVFRRGL